MSALPKLPKMSEAEYLAFEENSETRHYYFNGEIYDMAGASREHNLISTSTTAALYNQLAERPCEVYSSDMRLKVLATGLYTYPHISAVCGEAEFTGDKPATLINPQVIIEILSPSTARDDRTWKFAHYREIASLQEYLLISQDEPRLEHYRRQKDNTWLLTDLKGLDVSVKLASIDCTLKLADIYKKINFSDDNAANQPE